MPGAILSQSQQVSPPWHLTVRWPRTGYPASRSSFFEYLLVGLAIGLCSASALICLSVQWIPYVPMHSVVAAAIPAGYADRFTPAAYAALVGILRAAGVLCLVATAFALVFRHRVARALECLKVAAARDFSTACIDVRFALRERPHVTVLFGIVLASAILRGMFLTGLPHNDEAYTFTQYASRPPIVGLLYYTANNHVLHTLLVHLTTALLGPEIWALRLPAFLGGLLLIPALYVAVRLHSSRDSAILAAALAGVSMPLIEYSANARGYSIGTLFLLVMVIAVAGAGPTARGVTGAAAALAVFSVPTMLYGVIAILGWTALRKRSLWFILPSGAVFSAIAAIFYAPALAFSGLRAVTANKWTAPLGWEEWAASLWGETLPALQPWTYWTAGLPWAFAAILCAAAVAGMVWRPGSLYTVALAVALCMITVQRVSPPKRVWLFLVPLMIWCASDVLAGVFAKFRLDRLVPWAALGIWVAAAPFVAFSKPGPDTRGDALVYADGEQAARWIALRYPSGSRVICCSPWDSVVKYELARTGYPERHEAPELVIAGGREPLDLGELDVTVRPVPFCCSARLYEVERESRLMAQAEKMRSTSMGGASGRKRSTGTESTEP